MPHKREINSRSNSDRGRLNVLLSNGRFPVTLDLARQIHAAGHRVFVVDAMHYHVCKFSRVVKRSYQVPAPRDDARGYIDGVMRTIRECDIDILIPMHEEILYLAEEARTNAELRSKLLAPPFHTLIMLHNKWEFSKFLTKKGLGVPRSSLCQSYDDVVELDRHVEWAVKPVYGRASSNVHHLEPGKPIPTREEIDVDQTNHYVAQEWARGARYCTYSVLLDGHVAALAVYPVQETIDGSSCVYFEAIEKPEITAYVDSLAAALPGLSGQIALDLVETAIEGEPGRTKIVAIECNPRATSGIHLYSRTTRLANVMTSHIPIDATWAAGEPIPDHVPAPTSAKTKVAPGMLLWKPSHAESKLKATALEYVMHMKRLVMSRDVIWSWRDLNPSLMQPFLLTSYYEICREKGLKLPTMFQHDYIWEPKGHHLEEVRRMFGGDDEGKHETFIDRGGSISSQ